MPKPLVLSPEMRLVAASTLWPVSSPDAAMAISDWESFYQLVERHRVAPAVYRCLAAVAPAAMPAAVRGRLAERARLATIRAMHHAAASVEAVGLLERGQVDVLVLKGASLSRRIYGDPGMREVRDVDLLIGPENVIKADRLLREGGWQRTFPVTPPSPRRLITLLEREHHFEYLRPVHGVTLELHWQLEGWPRERVGWLWQHSAPEPWGAMSPRELDPVALLLLLVDHGATHQWFCLKWLADVAVLLARMDETISTGILGEADRWRLRPSLAQAALLVEQIYGLALPASWRPLIEGEPNARALADDGLRCLLGSEDEYFRDQTGWGWIARRRYLRRLHGLTVSSLFPCLLRPADFDEIPLPDELFWLYYPLRPLLWLRRLAGVTGGTQDRPEARAAMPR